PWLIAVKTFLHIILFTRDFWAFSPVMRTPALITFHRSINRLLRFQIRLPQLFSSRKLILLSLQNSIWIDL
ncbi:hypothetical protein VIGAN_03264100, partial [Vigna angularis var. angularis]